MQRATSGAVEVANEFAKWLEQFRRAVDQSPTAKPEWRTTVREMEKRTRDMLRVLRGDNVLAARNENVPVSIAERVDYIVSSQRLSLAKPTATQRDAYRIAGKELTDELAKLRKLIEEELRPLEKEAEAASVVWTSGRLPEWRDK